MNRRPEPCERCLVAPTRQAGLSLALIAALAGALRALAASPGPPAGSIARQAPEGPAFAAQRKRAMEFERTLNRIRVKHFGSVRVPDIRKDGVEQVRTALTKFAIETNQATGAPIAECFAEGYTPLLEIFEREAPDVRLAMIDLITERPSPQAQAALAWVACFDASSDMRAGALEGLQALALDGGLAEGAKIALAHALRAGTDEQAIAAAGAAESLKILEAIPLLIAAQVAPANRAAQRAGPKAFIFVGTQRTFVSDVTPVVGTSAVAFDPTVSTLNTGSLLVIHDSLVTSYRSEVHAALVRMTTEAWGRSTEYLGYDLAGWSAWYERNLRPALAARGGAAAPPGPVVASSPLRPPPPAPITPEMALMPVPEPFYTPVPIFMGAPGLPHVPIFLPNGASVERRKVAPHQK